MNTNPFTHIVLRDRTEVHDNLLPLTFTRPVAELRLGILTLRQKWELISGLPCSCETAPYLAAKFPPNDAPGALVIDSDIVPSPQALQALVAGEQPQGERIGYLYDLFRLNGGEIVRDFDLITRGRESQALSATNMVIGDPSLVFLEEGARVEGAILNTTHGPIYLGRDSEVMEGSCLRGPVAVCEHATVNMLSRLWPDTTIGPWCKVGGEINNVIFNGFSNKAHDGFLGNAVIGEWCNLGAGCVASNLRNTYEKIRLWNYPTRRFMRTDLQFCGLMMGDHSKAGINTMFNTATVVGVGCNVYGSGFPRNFVASFSEGSTAGFDKVPFKKFCDIARRVMARRNKEFTPVDEAIFRYIYDQDS